MDHFIRYAAREEVAAVIGRAMKEPSVQGVVIEHDPLWDALWRSRATDGLPQFLWGRHLSEWPPGWGTGGPEAAWRFAGGDEAGPPDVKVDATDLVELV